MTSHPLYFVFFNKRRSFGIYNSSENIVYSDCIVVAIFCEYTCLREGAVFSRWFYKNISVIILLSATTVICPENATQHGTILILSPVKQRVFRCCNLINVMSTATRVDEFSKHRSPRSPQGCQCRKNVQCDSEGYVTDMCVLSTSPGSFPQKNTRLLLDGVHGFLFMGLYLPSSVMAQRSHFLQSNLRIIFVNHLV